MQDGRVIPLHQNESYWLIDDSTASLYASHDPRTYTTYPEYGELREAFARYAKVHQENILLTAGSDAAIRLLADEFHREGKRVLLPVPTFYGYERIFAQADMPFQTIAYTEENGVFIFPLSETLAVIEKGIDAIFLCTPSNPLGLTVPADVLNEILDACARKDVIAVVDEAYFEYGGVSTLSRFLTQPLRILRTLSKSFGLAGARVGYLIAEKGVVDTLATRQLPWTISHPSVYAALNALGVAEKLLTRVALVHEERGRFVNELSQIDGMHLFDSCTNFLLTRVPNATALRDRLLTEGIRVAIGETMSSDPEARRLLKNTVRMAVPAPEDRDYVVASLRRAVAGGQ